MGWSVFGTAGSAVVIPASNFVGIGNAGIAGFGTTAEARNQVEVRAAGQIAHGAVHYTTATAGGALVTTLRKAAANTALAMGTSSAGYWYDDTDTVSVAVADLVNWGTSGAAGGLTITYMRSAYKADANHVAIWAGSSQTTVNIAASSTGFAFPARSGNNKALEANVKARIRATGAITDLEIFVTANATTSNSTIISRKNGGNGVLTFTIGAGGTGMFKDTTHSDSVTTGDDWCVSITAGATGALTYSMLAAHFANTTGAINDVFSLAAAGGDARAAGAGNTFYSPYGSVVNTATETDKSVDFGFKAHCTNMRAFVSANTYTGAATMTSRINAGAGNQTIPIGIGATGLFEDTTHSDDYLPTDLAAFAIAGGTANSMTVEWMGLTMQDTTSGYPKVLVF